MKSPRPKGRSTSLTTGRTEARTHADSTLDRLSIFVESAPRGSSARWSKMQNDYVLDLFRDAAKHVPAYRRFLKEHGIVPSSIKTVKDLSRIPPVSKSNYLRKYPWNDLCMPNALSGKPLVLSATSGSTGKPFYFPRTTSTDEQSYVSHRTFMRGSGLDPVEPTLVIVAFGMGVWIGGIITYAAFRRLSERDFALTILTPGVNKKEIYEALREIGSHYTQLVLCGYPPFIKDIIDDGSANGIKWKEYNMRVVCAAESFSEDFRRYVLDKTGMRNPYRDIMNIYGSAELGTMATETPLCILVRELSLQHPQLFAKIFTDAPHLPTLAQYIPSFVSFESVDNRIYCTAGSALPLIRYEIGDHGGTFTFSELKRECAALGIDVRAEARQRGIADTLSELPFVFVYERADLSTKLYGAIIYPEHVKVGLMSKTLHAYITGKFTMFTRTDEKHNEYLEINVELQPRARATDQLKQAATDAIVEGLAERNAEHKNNMKALGDRVTPRVVFWPHNHPEHFSPGAKHKWVGRSAS